MDGAVRVDRRREFHLDAIGPELNRDRGGGSSASALDHRKWELAAGEEACRQTAERGEGGLGEHLKNLFLLQVLDGKPDVELGVVEKDVEWIADAEGGIACDRSARELSGCGLDRGAATGEDVDAELLEAGGGPPDEGGGWLAPLSTVW